MTTSRERVMLALDHHPTDRLPRDLGGMRSTCVSCFAYASLVAALGLPPRLPRIHDSGQMLALPDLDVLDALGCDVVTVEGGLSNAFDRAEWWKPYDFGGRLQARIRSHEEFRVLEDGTVETASGWARMLPKAHVFDALHGGQPLSLDGDLPRPSLDKVRADLEKQRPTDAWAREAAGLLRRVRESSDRAILYAGGPQSGIGIGSYGGLGIFPMLCVMEPDFVAELHDLILPYRIEQLDALLTAAAPYIDVYMVSADDWGTQAAPMASPSVYRRLFLPYYAKFNAAIAQRAPGIKRFLHSCGAIYDLLDLIVESGFDVVNPVQWTAGGYTYRQWKEKCRGRLALWGGGVDTQTTLPLGTVEDVERQAAEVSACLGEGGGHVFCAIHNLLAETDGRKVVAMYEAAGRVRPM